MKVRVVKYRFWYHFGCSGRNVDIFLAIKGLWLVAREL